MIKQKKATDKAIYNRHKDAKPGDPMYAYKKWFESGKTRNTGTQWHDKAHEVLAQQYKDHTMQAIADYVGTYPVLIHRLIHKRYKYVREGQARMIAQTDFSGLVVEEETLDWDSYKKAQQILRAEYTKHGTYRAVGNKYGLSVKMIANAIKDHYKKPHEEIIQKVLEW